MQSFLSHIDSVEDLRKLRPSDLPILAGEIREFILDTLSAKPGHLGAGLGVVELTIALHYHFNTPTDLLIWDVGHQAYPHKILSGRKTRFSTLRQLDGISGFPARDESEFDVFGTGHSSTSISAMTGMALANRLQGKTNQHIAVIGDASIVSGMALEGLNHLGSTDLDVLIVLNDNAIGIDPSVGALKSHFFELNESKTSSVFESFGLHYKGVVDGHDFDELFAAFGELESVKGPKLLHIKTVKGKGYQQAEADQVRWHAPGRFNKETGEISETPHVWRTYQHIFGESMMELFHSNPNLVAITPAMLTGSHLTELYEKFPNRVFDVGIAEQHSVTLAAGLATQDIVPYCTVYSTFLQRAVDQVIHDVALQNLPVVFCIDRAGLVGTDGATHHGAFDISLLNGIPNLIISEPRTEADFRNLLFTAQFTRSPFAIRYPKTHCDVVGEVNEFQSLEIGKAYELKKGSEVAILSFGTIGNRIEKVLQNIENPERYGHYSFLFAKPLDETTLDEIFENYKTIITYENGVLSGGFGSSVLNYAEFRKYKGEIVLKTYPDEFVHHAGLAELEKQIGFDETSILEELQKLN